MLKQKLDQKERTQKKIPQSVLVVNKVMNAHAKIGYVRGNDGIIFGKPWKCLVGLKLKDLIIHRFIVSIETDVEMR